MKRGYIILIAGVILFIGGIIFVVAFGVNMATSILNSGLNQNFVLSDVTLDPSSSMNRTIQITDIEKPLSLIMHVESEGEDFTLQNASIVQEIISPTGQIENKNEFTNRND